MRTLKKSLCLVLALVFVLGLCTVGAGAAYSDEDKITPDYQSAIGVLSGLMIIDGYPDGTFGPEKNVTRAEAAAMITRMMLGREAADKLPVGEVKFSDVPADSWAAKYIAFCANKGIIVGMGNGTFCPNDNITGAQLAAMLLRALGYDAMGEYQGKGWDINAVADALYYGVFADSQVVDFSKAATREETALYIWNTLWINLVGYDVDLNYYKEKTRWIDDKEIGLTFANDAYDLKELGYKSKTNAGTYVVLANQDTGSKYTVVGRYSYWNPEYDADGKFVGYRNQGWRAEYNLDYKTTKDLIGHEVTVFLENDPQLDEAEHEDFYKCYLIKDESTEKDFAPLFTGATLDDFYRYVKEANKANLDVKFTSVKTITNYDYTWIGFLDTVSDSDDYYVYTYIYEVKGQKSSNDSAPDGVWIFDHAGNILVVRDDRYYVGKVLEVDEDHGDVEVEYFLGYADDYVTKLYDADVFDMKWNDIELVYEGIAEGDYVTVQPVGELTYIGPTTTEVKDITDKTLFIFWWYFNGGFPFGLGPDTYGLGIDVNDMDKPESVNVGDKVKFYLTSAGYFALEVVERAKTEGIVYINFIEENAIEHTEWDTKESGGVTTVVKVQGINQEGEEVVYKFSQDAWGRMKEKKQQPVEGKVYEVRRQGKSYFFDGSDRALKDVAYIENETGKTSFLRADGNTYYVTDDTKVIYFGLTGKDLWIEVANKLSKDAPYSVYALSKASGGARKLISVWVLDPDVEIPEDYSNNSYVYVSSGRASGYDAFRDVNNVPFYTVYKDGARTSKVHVTGSAAIYADDTTLNRGFYKYNVSDDGLYTLSPAANQNVGIVLGEGGDGTIYKGKLYVDDLSDEADLSDIVVLDVSNKTTINTKTNANVVSIERLEDMLGQGYKIEVDYTYIIVDGWQVPDGFMYVKNVVPPTSRVG